jgi:tRNA-Thr(GGU) m(6)t(6)A37 methyltransferase TsaA
LELVVSPIGVAHTPFKDRASAPRQPAAAIGVPGTIVLDPDPRYLHALSDLETFSRIWVLFWFHLNTGWKPMVRPPRSAARRGLFATRSPYRPNPIGMSALRLTGIEGRTLHVLDVDLVDGTPVLDLKPYVPYADSFPDSNHGWLAKAAVDPTPRFEVEISELAERELVHIEAHGGESLRARIMDVLSAGPSPHPYRRIRRDGDDYVLAVKDYRVRFRVVGHRVAVVSLHTGYRARAFAPDGDAPEAHRTYVATFGLDGLSGLSRPDGR